MTTILQKILIVILLFSFSKPVFAFEAKKAFYVAKEEAEIDGERHQLCAEITKILNEPQNSKFAESGFTGEEFEIPKKYKDFTQFDWQDLEPQDLGQYMKSEKWLEKIKKHEQQNSTQIIVQKTSTDFDNDENVEDILRFHFANQKLQSWSCYVSDLTPSKMLDSYNKSLNFNNCFLFKYKNRPFQFESLELGSSRISEPATPAGAIFIMRPICTINLTPLKIKAAEKLKKELQEKEKAQEKLRKKEDLLRKKEENLKKKLSEKQKKKS